MKRITVGLILISMMLHCSTRLGVVTYLFENRDHLALHLGLIDEVTITTCGQNSAPGTLIYIADENNVGDPRLSIHAPEILLFMEGEVLLRTPGATRSDTHDTDYRDQLPQPAYHTIHQPPKA